MEYWGQRWEQETSSLVRRPSWWWLGFRWCQWKLTGADRLKTYFTGLTNGWTVGYEWEREESRMTFRLKKTVNKELLTITSPIFYDLFWTFNFTDPQGETWGGQATTQWLYNEERYGSPGLGPSVSSGGQLCASFGWEGIWTLGLWLPRVALSNHIQSAVCEMRYSET